MKTQKLGLKLLVSFLLVIPLVFIGMGLSISASVIIQGPTLNHFMSSLAWVFVLLLYGFVMVRFFIKVSKKKARIVLLSILVLMLISAISVHQFEQFQNRFRIGEPGINLYDYQPFKNNASLAHLDDNASFTMGNDVLSIDGIATLYPVYSAFVEATFPEGNYDPLDDIHGMVRVSNNQTAYARLINGDVDLIFAESPSESAIDFANQNGVTLNVHLIGYEALVFYVHKDNPVDTLTLDDIINIYSGSVTNWAELGGDDAPIEAFQRLENSASQSALKHIMGSVPLMTPPMERAVESSNIVDQTARYNNHPHAIGFSLRIHTIDITEHHDVKIIALDGVEPTISNISNELYPIVSKFAMVSTNSDHAKLEPFIAWVLSPEGQTLIERSGFVPITP